MNATTYFYPFEQVVGDYTRAGVGFVLMAALLLFVPMPQLLFIVFSLLALVFLGFAVHTALRHRMSIKVSDEEILVMPSHFRLRWQELSEVTLDFYAASKYTKEGLMQLMLRSRQKKLQLDSRLNGFDDIVRRAAASARSNNLVLSPTTVTNFTVFQIDLSEQSAEPQGKSNG